MKEKIVLTQKEWENIEQYITFLFLNPYPCETCSLIRTTCISCLSNSKRLEKVKSKKAELGLTDDFLTNRTIMDYINKNILIRNLEKKFDELQEEIINYKKEINELQNKISIE